MLHKHLTNVLTYEECDEIYDAFIKIKKRQVGVYNFKEAIKYVDKVKSVITDFGDLKFADVYTRTYYPNQSLFLHVDQDRYDLTVTINVHGLQNWQIHCSNLPFLKGSDKKRYLDDHTSYQTKRGEGVVCFGKQCVHWRNELIADKKDSVTQTLYHFTFV